MTSVDGHGLREGLVLRFPEILGEPWLKVKFEFCFVT